MIPVIKNLNLTWIRNNKELALQMLLIGVIIWLANDNFKQRDKHESHLLEDIKVKEKELEAANRNFENSLLLLKSMDDK